MKHGEPVRPRSFMERWFPKSADWIRQEIESRLNAEMRTQRQLLEQRAQLATAQAMAFAADHGTDSVRRLIEERGQLAVEEAKSYADAASLFLSKSVAAANMVVVHSRQRLDALEKMVDGKADAADLLLAIDGVKASAAAAMDSIEARIADRRPPLSASPLALTDRSPSGSKSSAAGADDKSDPIPAPAELVVQNDDLATELKRLKEVLSVQLQETEQRIEFVRSEILYELQAARFLNPRNSPEPSTGPIIVDPARVDAMRSTGLRLNVGCGHISLTDYLNVDGRALPGVDIVAQATAIPFQPGEVAEIRSAHLVEHFSVHILERVILPYWFRLLKPGGVLTTIAPDGDAMLDAVNAGEMTFEDFREVLFGGQDYQGDFHYNLITPKSWKQSLENAGFTDITEEYVRKRNGKCFEFKILARKP